MSSFAPSVLQRPVAQVVGDFSVAELHAKVPSVGLDLIRKVLKDEKTAGRVVPLGRGRAARWRKVAAPTASRGLELGKKGKI